MISRGTAGSSHRQSPMILHQPELAVASSTAAPGSCSSLRSRPTPGKNRPGVASQRPADRTRGNSGAESTQPGIRSIVPGVRTSSTPASRCASRCRRSAASSKPSSGCSAPGCVCTSTSPGTSQPPSITGSTSRAAPGPAGGSVRSTSPSVQKVRSTRSGRATQRIRKVMAGLCARPPWARARRTAPGPPTPACGAPWAGCGQSGRPGLRGRAVGVTPSWSPRRCGRSRR